MLNLKNPLGRRVDVKPAAPVSSGTFTVQNLIAGIPVAHAVANQTVAFIMEGLVAHTLAIGGTLAAGCFLYWDRTNSLLSLGAAAKDLEVAQIVDTLDSTNQVYLLRLNVGFPRAAAGNAQ
jgi:hypothetical protein